MDKASTRRVLCFLTCAPNGIQAMSAGIPGLVQTSLNLGILTTEQDTVTASFCVRSSVESQKQMLVERLTCLTETLGGTVAVSGDYAAWEYRTDSPLRERMAEVFREQYGHDPKIEAIHAGVERGPGKRTRERRKPLSCFSIWRRASGRSKRLPRIEQGHRLPGTAPAPGRTE